MESIDDMIIKDIDGPRGWENIFKVMEAKSNLLIEEIKELKAGAQKLEETITQYEEEMRELQKELSKYQNKPTISKEITDRIQQLKEETEKSKQATAEIQSEVRNRLDNVREILKLLNQDIPNVDSISLN